MQENKEENLFSHLSYRHSYIHSFSQRVSASKHQDSRQVFLSALKKCTQHAGLFSVGSLTESFLIPMLNTVYEKL